ncbi:hypothetical protein WOLCODRAFT_27311 [Wolfiporia cocos MD-104 SS10]|uniref:Uncharacterized protein n=1 Tax=Wolfiporia cocos (strain MD-104) TaxID=742152 RepID=A0A2H3IX85_WOLCO|nr:hypothetical protein WOLCODRAFT_27311 [Wolfiporia cocos MD-104 SS10]
MTNWADDVIEEETDDGEELRSDGDVLGEVVPRIRRRAGGVQRTIRAEEQWEVDSDAFKTNAPFTQFRQCAQMHSDWVNDILLCNQNQTLITASSDGTVRAWNPHSQDDVEPTTIGVHADYARCLAHSREQRWVASGSFDRTIKLWDLAAQDSSSAPLVTLGPPESSGPKASVYALATDPYGSIITSGSPERVIRMWDPRSGRRIGKLVGHTDNIRAMLLSEDAKYLLTGSADASVKLWSLSSQRCLHTFTHHTDSVWSLFSQHPTLEIFFSGDRSGLVCKVDVEGCADVSEGECVVICQDTSDRGNGSGAAEGVNKVVAVDDTFLWTATGSSSFKRWKVPSRKAVRAAALSNVESPITSPISSEGDHSDRRNGARNSIDLTSTPTRLGTAHLRSNSPPLSKNGRRTSLSPSLSPSFMSANSAAAGANSPHGELEGEETWYGIQFESLVRLTSPNDFGGHGPLARGRDPEIATLYSAASILSMPRLAHPMHAVLDGSRSPASPAPRSVSPAPEYGEGPNAQTRLGEETQTLHPGTRARAEYEEREVAADAIPYNHEPIEVVQGEHGLVRCAMLNDRVHALTVDTAGEVAVWDVIRGVCRGRFLSEDVAAASFCGSEASVCLDGESGREKEKGRSPREALETVKERIEGEAVVQPWASVDTKTGVMTVHLNERCFEAEIYADEAGYGSDRRYGDDTRLNIGKWVLRNLFASFIREEQRAVARRRDVQSHRLHRGTAPSHIDIGSDSSDTHKRASSESLPPSSASINTPSGRSPSVIFSPTFAPAMSPAVTTAPRTPLLTPHIPLSGNGVRDSGLSPIPQSPSDSTPMPMPQRAQTADAAPGSPQTADYFSLRARRMSLSTASTGTTDDYSLQTPTTPSAGGLMGRIRALGKSAKRQPSEVGSATPGGLLSGDTLTSSGESSGPVVKTPAQTLLSGPLNPPSVTEAPVLSLSRYTSVIISEEGSSGWTTLYRGDLDSVGSDARTLEEIMPYWLLEYLLANRAPPVPVTKVSFVLLPFPNKDPHGEQLPELLNTAQSKLTASRFLRVRKLTNHVQDKLDKIAGSRGPTTPNTPRSSFDARSQSSHGRSHHDSRPRAEDLYEIVCNDVVLPLDMTLAAVRQFIWRQPGELAMYYRRKVMHHH